jgi:TolB-like protein/DNA-binding winged helix-turn-helix (wHTH) protein/predicted Zn-dependent protease
LWQEGKQSAGRSHGKTLGFLWNCCGMPEQEKEQLDSVVSFGSYRLDGGTGQLWRGKQEVKVPPKAFTALRYFTDHPGQLVTKDGLFAAVWPQTIVTEATLASCIQELRSALRDDARAPRYIETVHRRGFRFIAAVTAAPVPISQFRVPSQDEEKQTANGNSSLASEVQSLESNGQELESAIQEQRSEPILDPHPLIPDPHPPASPRFWSRNSLMLTGLLLLVGITIIVQYLSLPLPSTQPLAPSIQSALPLPDKPSIIVLPFTNLSGDPTQDYFSDGLTEVLTSTLSRIPSLFVIARHSAFTYKGKGVKVQDVSREMGVRYVVEGSVLRTDAHIRIMAQLIDATTGYHLWSERYDRPLKDIFAVQQDEIVQKIVTTLKLQITLEEQGHLIRKSTDNPEAYDAFLRGLESFFRVTRKANTQARQMWENAIALDPQFAVAYAALGWTYYIEWLWRWSPDPQTLERAFEQAQQALMRDTSLAAAHGLLGLVYAQKKQFDQALAEMEQAVALNPNGADVYTWQAEVLNFAGRPEQALWSVEQAMRLNPHYPPFYLINLGIAYYLLGRYSDAISTLKSLLARNPNWLSAYPLLSLSYARQWAFQQNQDSQTLTQAMEAAQRAVALNRSYGFAHSALGHSYLFQRQHEQAIVELEQVIALDSNLADSYAFLAMALSYAGKSDEAVRMGEEALRRKPSVVDLHLGVIGSAYYFAGKPAEAIAPLKQYLARYPNILDAHLTLAAVYSELGQIAEARAAAAEVLRLNPQFSLEVHKQREPIKDPAMVERHIAALRKAGLK